MRRLNLALLAWYNIGRVVPVRKVQSPTSNQPLQDLNSIQLYSTQLCDACNKILDGWNFGTFSGISFYEWPMRTSISVDCHLCYKIQEKVKGVLMEMGYCLQDKTLGDKLIEVVWNKYTDWSDWDAKIKGNKRRDRLALHMRSSTHEMLNNKPLGSLDVVPDTRLFYRNNGSGLQQSAGQGTADSIKTMQICLERCRSSHEKCGIAMDGRTLPTSLIQLDKLSGTCRLCLTTSLPISTEYATLSHCWGDTPMFTLTCKNSDQLYISIPSVHLSKTFQQAIEVVINLDFHYLWIDSLCIVQGNHEDWSVEGSKMSEIYGNSSLNLVATAGENGTKGILYPKHLKHIPCRAVVPQVNYSENGIETRQSSYDSFSMLDLAALESGVFDTPLTKRAWAFQEGYLTNRKIHFTSTEVVWQCNEGYSTDLLSDETVISLRGPRRTQPSRVSLANSKPLELLKYWSQIIWYYSSRKLTYTTDKLPALSGVAKVLSQESSLGTYLAGLWESHLLWQLCWRATTEAARPLEYRAPTWSWACVDSAIQLLTLSEIGWQEPKFKVSVVEATTETLAGSEFGLVTSGTVYLSCRNLLRMAIENLPLEAEVEIHFDSTTLAEHDGELFWLVVARVEGRYGSDRFSGVVLQLRSGRLGDFRRVGSFTAYAPSPYAVKKPPPDSIFDIGPFYRDGGTHTIALI